MKAIGLDECCSGSIMEYTVLRPRVRSALWLFQILVRSLAFE